MNMNHKNDPWVFSGDIEGESAAPGVTRKVLAYCDELMAVANEFEEGAVGSPHSHPHTQITYVAEGRFRFTIGDETKEVAKGDTLCKRNGVEHGCVCLEKGVLLDFFTPMREDFVKQGETMQYLGFEAYKNSINSVAQFFVFMTKDKDETVIIISSEGGHAGGKTGAALGFKGVDVGDGNFRSPLTHENAIVLRSLFPFTAPVRGLSKPRSFGLGDRLGIATPGHIALFEKTDVFPIFAQQSIRELNLTGRTYEDVLDAATFAVFQEGYKKGFGADGDHLKTVKDVEYALSLGFTMITLDCSEHIKNDITENNAPPLSKQYADKYLNKNFDIEEGITLAFNEGELRQCAAIYGDAIKFAAEIYKQFFASGKYNADFEISIDETVSVTTPLQHFFVARELLDAGVSFATIAPRFCGEFQKGIDYKGDIAQFTNEIKVHAAIARHLGYKLSVHSGSDKFSVFPAIGRETRGVFHVKTAGTNWLEAMRVVAQTDPSLYREVHAYALEAFDEAKKYYHVTTDLSKIPDVSTVKDNDLPKLFENNDARQLIHITYGLILGRKNPDGSFTFRDRLYKLWRDHEREYRSALVKHIGKHLELLGIKGV